MDSWPRTREVEKPKTLTGRRASAVVDGETAYVRLVQQGEAARVMAGSDAPVTRALFAGAIAIRALIDAFKPGGKP